MVSGSRGRSSSGVVRVDAAVRDMEESSSGAADRPRPAASPPTATTPLPQPLELAAVLERPRGVSSIVDLKGAGVPSKPADLARSISELREGAQIFHDASQKRLSTRLLSLDGLAPAAAAELRGAYFLRAFLDGRATQALQGTPQEHYITADFFTPARCYILLPSLMRPPGWLHKHFRRFQVGESEAPAEEAHAAAGTSGASPGQRQQPDAAAAQELYACTVNVDLEVEWGHESLVRMLLFALSTTFSTQRLEVWQSKAVVRPGKPLVLGRALGGEDTDTNYVFAFKPLSADEVAAAEAEERAQLASPQAAGQGSSGVDRNRWIEQLVVQIESDDTDAVRKLLESARQLQPNGGSASTTSSPSRAKSAAAAAPSASGAASGGNGGVVSGSPSRASPGGRIASFDNGVTVDLTLHPLSPSPKLLCSVPLDYDNLEMLCLLMVRCNIEIDFACLHLLLANHSRVTSEFGGVQEVLLQYIQVRPPVPV